MKCSGLYTALITPFDPEGNLDSEGLCLHIKRQKKANVDGIVVLGTTGEAATLSDIEKERVVSIAFQEKEDLPLMVGCGTYSTTQTIENIFKAADAGADMALVIAPFYNKPTQEGIFRHFEAICKVSPLPIVVYNNPCRTIVSIDISTLECLADLPQIIGIKETSGSLPNLCEILFTIKKERPDFAVFGGDDNMAYAAMAVGCDGVISPTANLIPEEMVALIQACKEGHFLKAQGLNLELTPLFKALISESNPISLKAALHLAGLPSGNPRLPLTPLSSHLLPALKKLLVGEVSHL